MSNILITGDSGYLGSALAKELFRHHNILGLSRTKNLSHSLWQHESVDLVNDPQSKLQTIIDGFKPDIIMHYAAIASLKKFDNEVSQANIIATHKLLDATPSHCEFIFASSVHVYGKHNTNRYKSDKCNPKSVYGLTKHTCENLIRLYYESYHKIGGYKILRYPNHVSPERTTGIIYDIVQKLKDDNPKLELLGKKPGPKRPYIHLEDSIKVTVDLTAKPNPLYYYWYNSIHNIGPEINKWGRPNNSLTAVQVANIIMNTTNIHKPIKFGGAQTMSPGDEGFIGICADFKDVRMSEQAIIDCVRAMK